ncbi:MAG: hypothetical protein F6K04_21225 [Leptolyngbya sp. SIO4C5]|nr:hypothetical protein [Leptolyngbya sp. SIO4C5]
MPRVYLETFGCQMNELDSELVAGRLAQLGYAMTREAGVHPSYILVLYCDKVASAGYDRACTDRLRHLSRRTTGAFG